MSHPRTLKTSREIPKIPKVLASHCHVLAPTSDICVHDGVAGVLKKIWNEILSLL